MSEMLLFFTDPNPDDGDAQNTDKKIITAEKNGSSFFIFYSKNLKLDSFSCIFCCFVVSTAQIM